jgi:hypothetical protein
MIDISFLLCLVCRTPSFIFLLSSCIHIFKKEKEKIEKEEKTQ